MKKRKKSIFHIDENRLDQEVGRNPGLVRKYTEIKAEATKKRDDLRRASLLLEAQLKLRMRKRPGKFDLPNNPPMELVKAAILTNVKYQKMQQELAEAEYELDLADSAVKSLDDKSKRLRDLKELHLTNYRTEAGISHYENSAAYLESAQSTRKAIRRKDR